ncbi:unnamed protein product [Mucor hiemalis]
MPKKKVLSGLISSLTPYGKLIDVGIFVDKASQLFHGRGYAVIDVNPNTSTLYQPLTHVINWDNDEYDVIRATWKNMPTWCRYCHEDGHILINCEQMKAGIKCFNCREHGHRAKECPKKVSKTPFKNRNKRPRTTALQHADNSDDSFPTSDELLKSKYASKPKDDDMITRDTTAQAKEKEADTSSYAMEVENDLIDSSGEEDPDYVEPGGGSDIEELPAVDSDVDLPDSDEEMGDSELQDLQAEQIEYDSQFLPPVESDQPISSTNRYTILARGQTKPNMSQQYAKMNHQLDSHRQESADINRQVNPRSL